MADDNLGLEHPKHIRRKVDGLSDGMTDLTERVGRLERNVADLHGDFARLSARLDRLDERVGRIEDRLDLIPAE